MKRSIPAPTVAQKTRQMLIREIGCAACLLDGHGRTPCEIHHLNDRGRNISQDHTVGLCEWHHRGVPRGALRPSEMEALAGPSLARAPRAFHERYGSDAELLEAQNRMVDTAMAAKF